MKVVKGLELEVKNFNGGKNSKEFKSLDETLTRHLEALDAIEACGMEYISQKRKECVDFIMNLLSNLEAKTNVQELPTISSFVEEALCSNVSNTKNISIL